MYSILEQSSYSSLGYALNNKLHLTNAEIQLIKIDLPMRTQSAAGWIIFLLIVVLLYQTFAVVQLFLYIPPLYMKIPIRKTFWYLFPLIVCLVTIFSTLCDHNYVNPYLIECCGQYNLYDWISTSYHSHSCQWIEMLVKILQSLESTSHSSGNSYTSDSEAQGLIFQQYFLNIILPIIITFVSSKYLAYHYSQDV